MRSGRFFKKILEGCGLLGQALITRVKRYDVALTSSQAGRWKSAIQSSVQLHEIWTSLQVYALFRKMAVMAMTSPTATSCNYLSIGLVEWDGDRHWEPMFVMTAYGIVENKYSDAGYARSLDDLRRVIRYNPLLADEYAEAILYWLDVSLDEYSVVRKYQEMIRVLLEVIPEEADLARKLNEFVFNLSDCAAAADIGVDGVNTFAPSSSVLPAQSLAVGDRAWAITDTDERYEYCSGIIRTRPESLDGFRYSSDEALLYDILKEAYRRQESDIVEYLKMRLAEIGKYRIVDEKKRLSAEVDCASRRISQIDALQSLYYE